ncbi:MAG: hypothetical protein ISS31_08570 [Kiritimatiellae bacterium]|nr:hypothetical protein [Kiritimatiellia bacterium]
MNGGASTTGDPQFPTDGEVEQAFRLARESYFPRWDRCGRWKIEKVSDLSGLEGYCDQHGQRILVCPPLYVYDLTSLIVHEIVHAIYGGVHGKRFTTRLQVIADRARSLGDFELAKAIDSDLEGLRNPDSVDRSVEEAYATIRNYVEECYPKVSFERAVLLARSAAHIPEVDFLRTCPRARAVFDNEVAAWEEDKKRAAEMTFEEVQARLRSWTPERLAETKQRHARLQQQLKRGGKA